MIYIDHIGGYHMKTKIILILIILISFFFSGCSSIGKNEPPVKEEGTTNAEVQTDNQVDEGTISKIVESFGSKLKEVSLLAPKDILTKSMQDNYSEFVTQDLINEWISDPQNAPGRLTSSPWPDRIEVISIEKLPEDAFEVKGKVIEITSVEEVNGGIAASRPITLLVKKKDDQWLINAVTLGEYEDTQNDAVTYKNVDYGFSFSLPETWKDYKIETDHWEGVAIGGDTTIETGPIIYIRNPEWTTQNQRQDIPIMIFTLNQWNALQEEKFHIGAAPMGPSELGRNTRFVFALPARYNYAFLTGVEEVEEILQGNPLLPNE